MTFVLSSFEWPLKTGFTVPNLPFEPAHEILVPIAMSSIVYEYFTVFMNSECCGESAQAATTHLCNHQCVESLR